MSCFVTDSSKMAACSTTKKIHHAWMTAILLCVLSSLEVKVRATHKG